MLHRGRGGTVYIWRTNEIAVIIVTHTSTRIERIPKDEVDVIIKSERSSGEKKEKARIRRGSVIVQIRS